MDDKRDVKKKDKKSRKSRSRSREKRRSPSRSPSYGRRRRERSRSRERLRRRSRDRISPPIMRRRGRGRRSPSPPPPPPMQQAPPPPMIGNPVAAAAYMGAGPMYDAYGAYPPPSGGYIGEMDPSYVGYDYGGPGGPPADGYGAMMGAPPMIMGQPGPPGEEYAAGWEAPPPVPIIQETEEEKRKREAAIASEVRNQRASLKKQRDDYRRRAGALNRELKTLIQQRNDLCSGRDPPSPTTNSFIKENDKLQSQIQSKIDTIENVIDMLDGIIGKDKSPTPPPPTLSGQPGAISPGKERKESESSASPERLKNEVLETMKRGKAKKEENAAIKTESVGERKPKPQYNYIHYDPELHWCSKCDIFPKTAKDYLNHLHSEQHLARVAGTPHEYPWREKQQAEDNPNYPDLPSKRTPIRGLQFFVPATAWYCKICDYWMGDLPAASTHLKSRQHGDKYGDFIDSHPNFEIDWMSDRQKAYERMRDSDRQQQQASTTTRDVPDSVPVPVPAPTLTDIDFLTGSSGAKETSESAMTGKKKKKNKKEEKREKKKKKRSKKKKRAASSSSSSSSSDSDSDSDKKSSGKTAGDYDPATSIRVAMRNILKAQEAAKDTSSHHIDEAMAAAAAAAGKWTVIQPALQELSAPPPPAFSAGAESREKKRDELMMSQWVTPEPIISESEKKLLEQLKGKLKKRDDGPSGGGNRGENPSEEQRRSTDEWRRSRSASPPWRRNSRSPGRRGGNGGGFGRDRRSPDRRRDRSRNREVARGRFDRRRRSRSRGRRSPSYGRGRFRTRRSYSRSRSRSRSRGRRVIEKPVVNFPPEPKPKPEKKPKEKKDEEKKEKKPVSMAIGQKKLPFIGRMPVFKKQQQEVKKEEMFMEEHIADGESISAENGARQQPEEFIDMMPDPYQFVALMGAPPPPPSHPGKPDQNILPPGIDEAEADLVPKPISDAPIPRKGPLPKDFQKALDIIFDGDKPKPAEMIANETKPPEVIPPVPIVPVLDTDQPQMIVPEAIEIYNQQIAAQYSTAVVSAAAVSYDDESQNQPLEMVSADAMVEHSSDSQLPGAYSPDDNNTASNDGTASGETDSLPAPPPVEVENEETRLKRAELEELALLGIDADDMAAQIF
ncbi:zinc finger matrin-type protein CG9776 [Toxorhynchites rutilus septentrionalis]|uniref:zinc finger matrin-type protein CG9776 n=1 Tax=Toxorhynchites rutilus septentrionalis TaxID=329112 RepID=UPI0024789899|nr:zinc finger matrin-type protein CG9776 [Toxorhynchites rutilus septentrionalis]